MVATRRDQRCTAHSVHIDYSPASAALAPCWIASAVARLGPLKAGGWGGLLARSAMLRFDLGEGAKEGKPSNEARQRGGESKAAAFCGDARCGS